MLGQISRTRPKRIERFGSVSDDLNVMTSGGKLLKRGVPDVTQEWVPERHSMLHSISAPDIFLIHYLVSM